MPKGQPRSSTQTLLRMLAKDAKSERVRLRACELLLILEGKLEPKAKASAKRAQVTGKSEAKEAGALARLAEKVESESPASQG